MSDACVACQVAHFRHRVESCNVTRVMCQVAHFRHRVESCNVTHVLCVRWRNSVTGLRFVM